MHEAHPAVPLWTWDADEPRIRPDRSYFGPSHVNDTFPANGAREWQWTLGDIVTTVIAAGLRIVTLGEHPEPFWRPDDDTDAAAWHGRLPNSFTLVAKKFCRACRGSAGGSVLTVKASPNELRSR